MEKSVERFTLNGKVYQAKEIDFNFICMLEVEGIGLSRIGKSFMNVIKVYAAYCMDTDTETAGNEIQDHVIKCAKEGVKTPLAEITDIVSKKLDESDFFLALQPETEESETTETPKKKSSKSEAEE